MTKTKDLYTVKDKQQVREQILNEQEGLCIITGLKIEQGQAILEHKHDKEMFVRGVASRQANSALGVFERAWPRYLKWWYPGTLAQFLRQCATFLEREPDKRFRHDQWIKAIQTRFNALTEPQKTRVLDSLGESGNNAAERCKAFKKVVMKKQHTFDELSAMMSPPTTRGLK